MVGTNRFGTTGRGFVSPTFAPRYIWHGTVNDEWRNSGTITAIERYFVLAVPEPTVVLCWLAEGCARASSRSKWPPPESGLPGRRVGGWRGFDPPL